MYIYIYIPYDGSLSRLYAGNVHHNVPNINALNMEILAGQLKS